MFMDRYASLKTTHASIHDVQSALDNCVRIFWGGHGIIGGTAILFCGRGDEMCICGNVAERSELRF